MSIMGQEVRKMDNSLRDSILAFVRENPTWRSKKIANHFQCSRRQVATILDRYESGCRQLDYGNEPVNGPKERLVEEEGDMPSTLPFAQPASFPVFCDSPEPESCCKAEGVKYAETKDGATCSFTTRTPIKTVDEAMDAAGVDRNVWEVEKLDTTHNSTETVDKSGKPNVKQSYRVHLKLKRVKTAHVATVLTNLLGDLRLNAPEFAVAPPTIRVTESEPVLASIAAFDVHFGRLAWAPEAGEDCDLKITDHRFRTVVKKLVEACKRRNTVEIVFPCGSDFFQMDNPQNTTTSGTPQDVDGRYAKVFETGLRAYLWAVERFAEIAPTYVPLVPGNHDRSLSYHLAMVADAYFSKHNRVKVDPTPISRKYHHWNSVLLGFTHGNEEKSADLPIIMATEKPNEWAKSTCREWAIGHIHQSRKLVTKPVDTFNGVTIRTCLSIAGQDKWHHGKGYVGAPMGSEAHFYGKDSGYIGTEVAKP